eukprot:1306031-Rhodomonas_salina.1
MKWKTSGGEDKSKGSARHLASFLLVFVVLLPLADVANPSFLLLDLHLELLAMLLLRNRHDALVRRQALDLLDVPQRLLVAACLIVEALEHLPHVIMHVDQQALFRKVPFSLQGRQVRRLGVVHFRRENPLVDRLDVVHD